MAVADVDVVELFLKIMRVNVTEVLSFVLKLMPKVPKYCNVKSVKLNDNDAAPALKTAAELPSTIERSRDIPTKSMLFVGMSAVDVLTVPDGRTMIRVVALIALICVMAARKVQVLVAVTQSLSPVLESFVSPVSVTTKPGPVRT